LPKIAPLGLFRPDNVLFAGEAFVAAVKPDAAAVALAPAAKFTIFSTASTAAGTRSGEANSAGGLASKLALKGAEKGGEKGVGAGSNMFAAEALAARGTEPAVKAAWLGTASENGIEPLGVEVA
jgi:hypothetical protein